MWGRVRSGTTGEGGGGDVAEAHGFRWKYEKTHADQAFSVMETYVVMNLPFMSRNNVIIRCGSDNVSMRDCDIAYAIEI